ncbi:MAG: hypothetical protein ACYDBV_15255 [Nitrospiria bacterium]
MSKKTIKVSNKAAAEFGRIGGKALAEKGSEYMSNLGKKGAEARWKNNEQKKETAKVA